MVRRRKYLPQVPIYELVSIIPDTFGGMVTVALQRSSAFADLDGRRIDILTKSPNIVDQDVRTQQLRSTGQISGNVRIRNVWSDLGTQPDEELVGLRSQVDPVLPAADELPDPDRTRQPRRFGDTEDVLQIDRFRSDGTRAICDERDAGQRGVRSGRLITLFTRDGRPLAQWRSERRLYHAWLDWVIGEEESILIVDSATAGSRFFDYQRDNVTTVQAIHNHHLLQMRSDERGGLAPSVMRMLSHLDWFDAVAILTPRQQAGFVDAGVVAENSFVAPNMLACPAAEPVAEQRRSGGVIVARQTTQKRLDHALRALALARAEGVDTQVEIFGLGPLTRRLTRTAERLDLGDVVRWRGYDANAKQRFGTAVFTLMSSRYEGHPVALLEAMSAGCIPIVYDIEFGPSDVVTDGVDGFLVPSGDIQAMADALVRVHGMPARERARMRTAAIRRAQDFSPENVAKIWGKELARARRRQRALRGEKVDATLLSAKLSKKGLRLRLKVVAGPWGRRPEAMVGWIGRGRDAYGRVRARVKPTSDGCIVEALLTAEQLTAIVGRSVLDLYVFVRGARTWGRARIASAKEQMPPARDGLAPYTTAGGNVSIRREA
ncbi:glycosyltransferase [Brachybacterium tyrofermentans]|uniref:glycosyltransferase n=1 Tax=Brachybacterium tyrofermentans TaxID=47848 RepID=UPI003F8EC66F